MDLEKAKATQIANISTKTGQSIAELAVAVNGAGLAKHSDKVAWVKANLGLGHGDANALVLHVGALDAAHGDHEDPLDRIYAGPRAALRPIHEAILREVTRWGDFEVHPKKSYVALRRARQFATVGPATSTRLHLGLNSSSMTSTERLRVLPPGGMCQYGVDISDVGEVDDELFVWLRIAYEGSAT
ncbi:MAG: DUF5655 domain-containing protein [Propionibacteriaceae bacterium]